MTDNTTTDLVPLPGTDLVPDGWADSTVRQWLEEQTSTADLPIAAARLAALEAAYRTLDADTLELVKARRYLEVRWGELLGPAERGGDRRSEKARDQLARERNDSSLSYDDRNRFRQLADAKDRVLPAVEAATDSDEISRASLLRVADPKRNGALYTSDSPEWYTPAAVLSRAEKTLGRIDLDPCSDGGDKPTVPASFHYTIDDDGLAQRWTGRVYMNPPYGRNITAWVEKLVAHHTDGDVPAAVALLPARTDTAWFRLLRDYRICFVTGRLRFSGADAAPFPSAVVYLGTSRDRFTEAFADLGDIYERIR